ncbi:MAG: Uma2 family endonuclease [Methylococcaceae bacterium]|nr:MAG: Uma2 family endonuclease [Methylococcaceae bacterium]
MATITRLSQLDPDQTYSYADYLTWQFEETIELIKGKIMPMSPAPNVDHQRISARLTAKLYNFFGRGQCQIFAAPFDVRLYNRKKSVLASKDVHTVVQPDLCVICHPEILDEQGCNGAPDWIIEILSKGNSKREMQTKYELYQEAGVSEYWLVYPYEQAVHQFVLDKDSCRYRLQAMYSSSDTAVPRLFPDLVLDLSEVFGS